MNSKNSLLRIGFIVLCLLFSQSTLSADIVVQNSDERYTPAVNISGAIKSGVMKISSKANASADALYVDVIGRAEGYLCIDIISVDGYYEASLTAKITQNTQGVSKVQFNSQFDEILKQYSPDDLAVLAHVMENCDTGKNFGVVPASWGTPKGEGALNVILNLGKAKGMAFVKMKSGRKEKFKCHKIKHKSPKAYDTKCEISNVDVSGIDTVRIKRKYFRENLDDIVISMMVN